MMSPEFDQRVRAVVDEIMPADQDPGALDIGADRYVFAQLERETGTRAAISKGLLALDEQSIAHHGATFANAGPDARREMLIAVEAEAWFISLSELVAEGVYADPANGGNLNARSWRMIGYEHRLPDGPSGRLATSCCDHDGNPG